MNFKDYIKINKDAWNKRTPIHMQSKFYKNEEFKNGNSSLKSIEINALGDINKKKLLHLQCHFGQDSISLSKIGAQVTAVDFSDVAIKNAQEIAKKMNVEVRFIEQDITKLNLKEEFDIIFTSYGVIGWLPDLNQWASVIAKHLKKGGLFLLTEFHPFIPLLNNNECNYFYTPTPDIEKKYGSYTDGGKDIIIEDCWWSHSLTEIFFSLEANGMKLQSFKEFDYSPYLLDGMTERNSGEYVLANRTNQKLPYVFTLKATKK